MLQQENFLLHPPQDVRSNTHYVHLMVTPSAAWQLSCRLRPHRGLKGCGDHTIVWGGGF